MRQVDVLLETALQADFGLDLTHALMLEYAAHTDLGPSQLSVVMRLDDHTVSRALGRLERAGLLERSIDKEDARRRVLRATPLGRSALERFHVHLAEALAPLLRQLGHERLESLLQILTLLVAAEPERSPKASPPAAG